jgi:hypothetical protein
MALGKSLRWKRKETDEREGGLGRRVSQRERDPDGLAEARRDQRDGHNLHDSGRSHS